MQYYIGPLRKFQFLMIPILGFIFFSTVLVLAFMNNAEVNPLFVLVVLFMIGGVSIAPWILFRNYLQYNRDYVLETGEEGFRLRVDNKEYNIKYDEIIAIDEYMNTSVTPWYYCEYWEVKTQSETFRLTSLLISRNDFFVRFPVAENLKRHSRFLPRIEPTVDM